MRKPTNRAERDSQRAEPLPEGPRRRRGIEGVGGWASSAGGRWQIPVARALFARLDLDGRTVSLDALHTQAETARALVLEHGADYLLTVKSLP